MLSHNSMKHTLPLGLIASLFLLLFWTTAESALAATNDNSTVKLEGMYTKGSGDIIAVEYVDLECSFCKKLYHTMVKVMDKYQGKLVWGYKNFPVKIHSKAKRESLASECAAEQKRLYPFMKNLFRTTTFSNNFSDHDLVNLALGADIEPKQFRRCLKSRKYLNKVNQNIAEGKRLGVTGTPTLLLVDSSGQILDRIDGAVSVYDISIVLDQYID